MYRIVIVFMLGCFLISCKTTQIPLSADQLIIKNKIETLFDGMRNVDSTLLIPLFDPKATLESVSVNKDGETMKRSSEISGFITAVGSPREELWDERILSYEILVDGPLAYAWTPYQFYVGEKLSHCGVNVFQFLKTEEVWKIHSITDTRRRGDCDN